VVVDRFSK